jgi:RluA family pseudouridine synthase
MISIIHEDDDVVVVDKPEGLAAIPERMPRGDSLAERLGAERGERLYIVHRIDKATSGLIVFARSAAAHQFLCRQFELREVGKTYLAVVGGVIEPDEGLIDRPLRTFGSGRMGVDADRGKPCITEFRVVERFAVHTFVEARPKTGRRHQIRVHLYSIGHPVAGDPLYGESDVQRSAPRLMLHSHKLALRLPSRRALTLESPLPESFLSVLADIRTF